MNTHRIHLSRTALVLAVLGLGLVACGSDSDEAVGEGPQAASGTVGIDGAWARTSPANAANGAAYMVLTSPDGDTLLGVEVGATIAGKAELHETVMAEPATDDSMATDSMAQDAPAEMTMQEVERVALPAGESVALEPGGYHIMLLDLAAPLEIGQTFSLELIFETAGTKTVEVTVADDAP